MGAATFGRGGLSLDTLLIQGSPGTGKTHLGVALGVRAVECGFGVVFYRLEELLAALRRDADLTAARLRRKKYLASSLLIIDEVGFEPMTRQEASLFFRLVSHRYQRGSILITTNKGIKDWPEILAGDEVHATAILDRLLHNSHVLDVKGRPHRPRVAILLRSTSGPPVCRRRSACRSTHRDQPGCHGSPSRPSERTPGHRRAIRS